MEVFKKRKRETNDAVFNEAWTEDYFLILVNNVPTCLICYKSLSTIRKYNINRHYITHHSDFESQIIDRKESVFSLMKKMINVKQKPTRNGSNEQAVHLSFQISNKIAQHSINYTAGEFVKDCLVTVVENICPESVEEVYFHLDFINYITNHLGVLCRSTK
jgi:hypothetical protein